MKIGIDIDEVLIEHAKEYLKYHNKRFSKNFVFEELKHFLFWKDLGLEKEEIQPFFKDFAKQAPPKLVKNSVEIVKELAEKNDLFILTARPLNIKDDTIQILNKNFGNIFKKIIFSGEVHNNTLDKAEICKNEKISVLIEDGPEISEKCLKKGIKIVLFDQPWNRYLDDSNHNNLFRVKNWKEVSAIIEKIK